MHPFSVSGLFLLSLMLCLKAVNLGGPRAKPPGWFVVNFVFILNRYLIKEQGYKGLPKIIVSFSGGKDSTAMLHRLISWGYPIDAVIFFDTSWEFPQMYDQLNLVEKKTGLKIHRVKLLSFFF